jgi:transposase
MLRAICIIHGSLGYGVAAAMWARRFPKCMKNNTSYVTNSPQVHTSVVKKSVPTSMSMCVRINSYRSSTGPVADGVATPKSHAALQQRGVLPKTHIVDTGFLDAALLVESRDASGVDLLGPTCLDDRSQAREGAGFDAQHFQIDWAQQGATRPAGKISRGWTSAIDNRGNPVIKIKFSTKDCRRCDQLIQCVRSTKRYPRRTLTIWPQPQYQALQAARQREATPMFQAEYARRAGIEGTISRGICSTRLRHTLCIGIARVHPGHNLTAVGLNVLRFGE